MSPATRAVHSPLPSPTARKTQARTRSASTATSLTVDENFSVSAGGTLLSVSDTFFQRPNLIVPEPGSLLLLAAGFGALGWFGRRRDKRA